MTKDIREKIYDILVRFVLVVDDAHKRNLEPACTKEIDEIYDLILQSRKEEYDRGYQGGLEAAQKMLSSLS